MYVRRNPDRTWDLPIEKNADGSYTAKLCIVEGVSDDKQYRYKRELIESEVARHNANGGTLCELGSPVRNGIQMDDQVWEDRLFSIDSRRVCGKVTNLQIVTHEIQPIVIGKFWLQGPMAEYILTKVLNQENTEHSRPYYLRHRCPFRGFRPWSQEPFEIEGIFTWDFQVI